MSFTEEFMVVEGCNIHQLPYTAYQSGKLKVFPGSSTRRYCFLDYDSEFVDKLIRSDKYQITEDGYEFYEGNE